MRVCLAVLLSLFKPNSFKIYATSKALMRVCLAVLLSVVEPSPMQSCLILSSRADKYVPFQNVVLLFI